MKRKTSSAFVFLICVVLAVIAQSFPADATPGSGPWDVTIGWAEQTSPSLKVDIKMTLDADDTDQYSVCLAFSYNSGANRVNLSSSSWGSGNVGTFREMGPNVMDAGRSGFALVRAFVVHGNSAGCGTDGFPTTSYTGTGMAIRGRSSVTNVGSGQITQGATNSTPSAGTPLAVGASPVADPSSPTCSRTLTGTDAMTGQFTTTAPTLASGITLTATSWGWGDGSSATATSGLTLGSGGKTVTNHTYTALSTMPTGGWKPMVTATYTTATGLFNNGSTTVTKTCTIRADFLRPNITDPSSSADPGGSGDTHSTGDTGLDSCLPSGWDLLNPLAYIGGMGCVLKFLFIPSSDTTDGLGSLWGDLTSKAPFSVIYEAVTFIPDQVNGIITGLGDAPGSGARGDLCGSSLNGGRSWSNVHGANYNTGSCDDNAHLKVAGLTFNDSNVDILYFIHYGSLFILGGLFFYACYRGLAEIMK